MMSRFFQQWAFALRNVFRQRARSAGTLAAISLGVAGLILAGGFVQDVFVQLGEAVIHSQSGHIQIAKKGYREGRTRAPESFLIDRPETLKSRIQGEPGVQMVLARLGFSGVINNGKRDLGIVGEGVEPAGEAKLGTYLRYIEGRALADTDGDGIVIGQVSAASWGAASLPPWSDSWPDSGVSAPLASFLRERPERERPPRRPWSRSPPSAGACEATGAS